MTPRSEARPANRQPACPRGAVAAALLAALTALAPLPASSHAALLQADPVPAIRLHATYDTGAPMAGAQVTVFAPDAPAEAWSRGVTDAHGRYLFAPDPDRPGRWTVQVRQAGHGAVTHVEIAPDAIAITAATPTGPLQRAVMVALVAWGALGTALFFRRRRADDASA